MSTTDTTPIETVESVDRLPSEVLSAFFRHLGDGDTTSLLTLIDDDVDWLAAGDPRVPWTGQRHGKAAAAEFLALLGRHTEPVSFAVEKIISDSETAVAVGAFAHRVRDTGKVFECEFTLRIDVSAGRIVRYRIYEDSYAIGQAFVPATS